MSSYSTKIKTTLPKDRELNGLAAIREQLLRSPHDQHVAIVVLDCSRIIEEVDDCMSVPVARIIRIEPESDPDRAAQLLARARELSEERVPQQKPLLDSNEAAGILQHGSGLRLAGGDGHR
jgi:hypothetical protein